MHLIHCSRMNQSSQMFVLLSSPQWRQKMSFFKDMVSSRESCAIWRVNTLSSQCLWPLMFDLATFFKAVPSCFLPWDEGILRIQFSYSYPLPKHHLNLFIDGPYKDILQTYFPSPSFWASSLTPLFPLTLQPRLLFPLLQDILLMSTFLLLYQYAAVTQTQRVWYPAF